ncbi:serendipity locus protein delta-like [Tribolium madens]|uniref:serendipity locus protein delta-like n=1 Tax=Tribolium madens TaxID=41895 RepID=UPI001CF72751|nr:serendipity locus protein delta-like [Tribolium madens]
MDQMNSICRLCLSKSSVYYSIFERNILNMIEALINKVSLDNGISNVVCVKCSRNLKMAYNFQQKIKKNEQLLSVRIKQEPLETQEFDIQDVIKYEETIATENSCDVMDNKEVIKYEVTIATEDSSDVMDNEEMLKYDEIIATEDSSDDINNFIKCEETIATEDSCDEDVTKCKETMATEESCDEVDNENVIKLYDKDSSNDDSRNKFQEFYDSHMDLLLGETPPEIKKIFSNIRLKKITKKTSFLAEKPVNTVKIVNRAVNSSTKTCNICHREISRFQLERHLHAHRERQNNPNACLICGSKVVNLAKHILNNHTVKHKCNICDKEYTLKYYRDKHMKTHFNGTYFIT